MATSVGGVLMAPGRGVADVIVIDDPLKAGSGALRGRSKTAIKQIWYDNHAALRASTTNAPRLHYHRHVQRLHQDDLHRPRAAADDDWTVLSFPAIAEEAECVPFRDAVPGRRFHPSARRSPPSGPGGGG